MIRRTFFIFIIFFFIFFANNIVFANNGDETSKADMEARVTRIVDVGQETYLDSMVNFQIVEVEILSGELKNQKIEVKNSEAGSGMTGYSYIEYEQGDKIRIVQLFGDNSEDQFLIDGYVKKDGLILLLIIFIAVVVMVGKIWGFLSIIGLLTSFLVIFKFIIPSIISGMNPVFSAIIGSLIIIPATFYISHGFNKKTHVGVLATLISLIITGFLAIYFVNATYLTGFASEEAGFLQVERQGTIDIRGLLLAGIIIGTLGVLDDVTIGQASTVRQLSKVNKKMSMMELFKNGMKVGQDHISSMVNTLVLVYSGSALPLLLMFFDSQKSFMDILEYELIAEEIVRMLVGSIGLVLAAPLATIMAAYVFSRESNNSQEKEDKHEHHH